MKTMKRTMNDASREQHIQHELNTCKHFNGIQHDQCRAGVKYRDLFGDGPGWAAHLCCMREKQSTVTCSSCEFPTREEAEKDADVWMARLNRTTLCVKAAHDDAKSKGLKRGSGGVGNMPCPSGCGGTLRYSVASVNGHMHAACSTKGCVSWME